MKTNNLIFKTLKTLIVVIALIFSFFIGTQYSQDNYNSSFQFPIPTGFSTLNSNVISPSDHISNEDILFYNDKIVLNITNATYSFFANTKSMTPFLDSNSVGIEVKPKSEKEIKEGDIIAYKSNKGITIIHRVISIREDNEGVYYITKGDNNLLPDNEKIRFNQIEGILVGVIY